MSRKEPLMSSPGPNSADRHPESFSLDQVFLWLSDQVLKNAPQPAASVPVAQVLRQTAAATQTTPAAPAGAATGLSRVGIAEEAWLRQERERFEAFMAGQLELLQRQRQELSQGQSQIEARLVSR